jgi:4-amino-4-deoxy-L-arabinose transferase-like glycosyltransferase
MWAWLLFALAVLCVHVRIARATWASELSFDDEPAHYATAVMVFEYLRTALGRNPLAFAQSFYIRFPKVAFGHWPPVFYAVQSAAFFLIGSSIAAARAVSAAIAFTIAGLLVWRVGRWKDLGYGVLAGAVFLSVGTVQINAWQVMSDLLTGLFYYLAILAFSDFLASANRNAALRFVLWSVLAILTKGNAWALGIFAALAPCLSGRWKCFRSVWYWISGVLIVALGAPFYWLARQAGVGYVADVVQVVTHVHLAVRGLSYSVPFFTPVLLATTVLGFGYVLYRRWVCHLLDSETLDGLCAGCGILAQVLFLLIFPLTREGRYFAPSGILAAILFIPAAALVARALKRLGRVAALTPVALGFCVLVESGFPSPQVISGFHAAMASIPLRTEGSVILVSSSPIGEGDMVADRLEMDRARAGVVLRASQVLASSNWGKNYQERFQDADGVIGYLHSTGVRYIAFDRSIQRYPHELLLAEALQKLAGEFQRIGSVPEPAGSIDIYVSNLVDHNPPEVRIPGRGANWPPYRMKP